MTLKMSAWLDEVGKGRDERDEVPDDRADQRRYNEVLCDDLRIDDPVADGLATASPESAPTRFSEPAMRTAWAGVSTRVGRR